jgi:hypothetical protein
MKNIKCKYCLKEYEQNEIEGKPWFTKDICNDCHGIVLIVLDVINCFIQPERSKREDLDCKKCQDNKFIIENQCCGCLVDYLDESKMRCSEHGGKHYEG